MASEAEIDQLRRMVDDRSAPFTYSDTELSDRLDADSAEAVASVIWGEKAAAYADMVNMSEAGSSRNLGDLYKNALTMSTHFAKLQSDEDAEAVAPQGVVSRRITRT